MIKTPTYCPAYSCTVAKSNYPFTHFRNHYTAKSITEHIDQHHPGATIQVIADRDRTHPWKVLE